MSGSFLANFDVLGDGLESGLVDHRIHEVPEVADVADLDGGDLVEHSLLQLRPEAVGDVGPAGGGALLALVLEGAAHQPGCQDVQVGRLVGEDEVLAAGLADDAGIGLILADVGSDGQPDGREDVGGAGEVHAAEIGVVEDRRADHRARPRNQVDDAVGHSGLLQHLHDVVGGQHRCRRRLPDHRVSHQCRGGGQVARDRGEVEGRDREDEPLQRPVLHVVEDFLGGERLVVVDLCHEVGIEAPEVDQLTGGVDLGLVAGLAHVEHGGRVDRLAVLAGQQLRGLEQDRGPGGPLHLAPGDLRLVGGVDRQLRLVGAGAVVVPEGSGGGRGAASSRPGRRWRSPGRR